MNEEKEQFRDFDSYDHFQRFGFVMFPQNKKTYEYITMLIGFEDSVLEAGCGMGLGAAILERGHSHIVSTDKLEKNVRFARALYPWIEFEVWDIAAGPYKKTADVVVCVEAIEHVKDYETAIKNLIASAHKEVWLSTPNNSEETPSNPFHVREFSAKEFMQVLRKCTDKPIEIRRWDTFEVVGEDSTISPLIYRITL